MTRTYVFEPELDVLIIILRSSASFITSSKLIKWSFEIPILTEAHKILGDLEIIIHTMKHNNPLLSPVIDWLTRDKIETDWNMNSQFGLGVMKSKQRNGQRIWGRSPAQSCQQHFSTVYKMEILSAVNIYQRVFLSWFQRSDVVSHKLLKKWVF